MIFFTGFLIGIASLIPGISGGTILVITNKYDMITNAISHYREKENILTLLFLILGILLGTITFARIIEFCFYFFPNGTMIIFSSFLLFHLPKFIRQDVKKLKWPWFMIGLFSIFILSCFSIHSEKVIFDYPEITLSFLLYFAFCGAIDGFFTILPGISGSMIMMLLGPYFLYKSFLAHLSFQTIYFLLPLLFYFIGDGIGFFLGSKFSLYVIKKFPAIFFNIILGMILGSIFLILPPFPNHLNTVFFYILFILIGYFFYKIIQKVI